MTTKLFPTTRGFYMRKKKVVIQFVEAGHGHLVTAEAIAECLEKKYGDRLEIVRDYVFRDSHDKDLQKYEKFTISDVKKSHANKMHLGFQLLCMKVFGGQFSLGFTYSTVFKKVRDKLIKHMAKQKADMFISTHFMTLHTGVTGKTDGILDAEIVAYNPDHNTHGWWDNGADLFITNNPEATREAIEEREMDRDKVKTVNFMARKVVVDANESKEYYREKHGIPKDKFTVVLADGAYAEAKLAEYTNALLNSEKELTIIPICGKNNRLYKKYLKKVSKLPSNITLIPLPFIDYAPEIYKCADVFVTKSGPNAVTDAVFMNTPCLLNFYSAEIEKATCELFTENYKCAIYEPSVKKAVKLIEEWTEDNTSLLALQKNTHALDKNKNGAEEIADIVAERLLK